MLNPSWKLNMWLPKIACKRENARYGVNKVHLPIRAMQTDCNFGDAISGTIESHLASFWWSGSVCHKQCNHKFNRWTQLCGSKWIKRIVECARCIYVLNTRVQFVHALNLSKCTIFMSLNAFLRPNWRVLNLNARKPHSDRYKFFDWRILPSHSIHSKTKLPHFKYE